MRLDPVFLVAPLPKPPSMSSRRAFLGMGLAFVCGGAIGSACGYSMGRASAQDASAARVEEELAPSGDADLDELRRLAVKAPIEELMGQAKMFLFAVGQDYRSDEVAWRGVGRLAEHLARNVDAGDRLALARFAGQTIRMGEPAVAARYSKWLPELQAIK